MTFAAICLSTSLARGSALDGRAVLALDHHVHLGNVHALLLPAAGVGQPLQHLNDHDIRVLDVHPRVTRRDRQIEIPVFVHGRGPYEGHVYVQEIVIVPAQVAVQHGLIVA